MTVNEFLAQIPNIGVGVGQRGEYKVIIPEDPHVGDIDEIVPIEVVSVTWDDGDRRLIINW